MFLEKNNCFSVHSELVFSDLFLIGKLSYRTGSMIAYPERNETENILIEFSRLNFCW
jgi:hypothetical protein